MKRRLLLATAACAVSACALRREAALTPASRMRPMIIAHRGASAYRPEHTLAAYQLAIEQGADFIEPDLVPTRDGVLIARHENELSGSTDVAQRPVFADRRTRKTIDGVEVEGWFAEDFTLDEIKQLRAIETQPAVRAANRAYDGQFEIPSLAEVIALARQRGVGVYPETKHPSYFAREGVHLDGTPIALSTSAMLLDALIAGGLTEPERVYIQSFEIGNLLELHRQLMPARGLALPLVALYGDLDPNATHGFAMPFDFAPGAPPSTAQVELRESLGQSKALRYADLAQPAALAWLRANGVRGVGPWKEALLSRVALAPARDLDRDGRAELAFARTGAVHPLIADARAAGLEVHPYTLRAEERFLALGPDGEPPSLESELRWLAELGCSGWFTDFPDRAHALREQLIEG